MQFPTFFEAASEASAFESAHSHSVVRDVYDVLSAAAPASPDLTPLAARAIETLDTALREAAGSPTDGRWRAAYYALAAFLECYARESRMTSNPESFERLGNFLAENADLVLDSAEKPVPFPRALAHAHGS